MRKLDWAGRLSIAGLVAAAVALIVFSGILSAVAFALAALMGWTQAFEENAAKGKPTMSGKERAVVAAILVVLGGIFLPNGDGAVSPPESHVASIPPTNNCPAGAQATTVDFAVNTDGTLRTGPDNKAAAVQISIGNETLDAPLEVDATIRQLCRVGAWSRVHVLTAPKEFQPLEGWVHASLLRKVAVTKQGRRIYEAGDFEWPTDAKRAHGALLAVMNRIMRDNAECDALDTDSLVANRVAGRVVYSVPCWSAGNLRSFDFTAADAANGRNFAPVAPIAKLDAINACKQGVLHKAAHPSSVEFPTFDYNFREGGNGIAQVLMSAKARNGFNLQLKYDVQCDFLGEQLRDVIMSEARSR